MSIKFVTGGFEIPLAVMNLVITAPLIALFVSNRHLYPLRQREPILAAFAAGGHTLMVSEWFLDSAIEQIPFFVRKVFTTTCFLFIFSGFFVRAWILWLDSGLVQELVQGKEGWFIRNRYLRSKRFLNYMKLGFILLHFCQLLASLLWGSYTNLMPARVGSLFDPGLYVTIIPIWLYFVSYIVWSFLLRRTEDGFYIKSELRAVGGGCGLITVLWFVWLFFRLPCSFPNCRTFILWCSMVWMTSWAIVFPLRKAMQDPRFSYKFWKCQRRRKTDSKENSQVSSSESENFTDHIEMEEAPIVRKLSEASVTKLRQVGLAAFLSYGPAKDAFRAFLVKEFSVENLLFIEAVQAFNASPSKSKDEAQALYDKYIAASAPNQVNLPSVVIQRATARLGDLAAGDTANGLFDEPYEHIMKLMQRDAFKRFQFTDAWHTHVIRFRVDKKPAAKTAPAKKTESDPETETTNPTKDVAVEVVVPSASSEPEGIALEVLTPSPAATESHGEGSAPSPSSQEAEGLP